MNAAAVSMGSGGRSALSAYMNDVTRLARPRLDRETEAQYAREGRYDLLVESFLPLAIGAARKYARSNVELEDLIQNANIGLMVAAQKFDPERGFRFTTYAANWLRSFISRYAFEHGRIVRLPARLEDAQRAIRSGKATRPEDLEKLFGMRPDTALAAFEVLTSRAFAPDVEDDDGRSFQLADGGSSPEELFADREAQHRLEETLDEALATLTPREREVIERRYMTAEGDEETLQEVADRHGLSRERIRQIQEEALKKLRAVLDPDPSEPARRVRTVPIATLPPPPPPEMREPAAEEAPVQTLPSMVADSQDEGQGPHRVLGHALPESVRRAAVERVVAGETVAAVARDLRVKHETLRRWVDQARTTDARARRHSEATRERAVDLVRHGASMKQACAECGVSYPTLSAWCKAAGVRSSVTHGEKGTPLSVRVSAVDRARRGESATSIALDLGVTPKTVWNWCREAGVELDAHRGIGMERRASLVEAVRRGATYSDVAAEFDVTIATVKKWCSLAGVKSTMSRSRDAEDRRPATFDPTTRAEIVDRVRNGESIVRVASTSGISQTTVTKWCRKAGVASTHAPVASPRIARVAVPANDGEYVEALGLPVQLHRCVVAIVEAARNASEARARLADARAAIIDFETRVLARRTP